MTRPQERVLDRLVSFDERSRAYPIRTLVAGKVPRSYTWAGGPAVLDQGTEGACVGFSIAGELAARPVAIAGVNEQTAFTIYRAAQMIDEWPGEGYSGTSVLAGMKTATLSGYYTGYRWAFSLLDLILAIGYAGPVVLGVNWREGMWDPDADGTLHVEGAVAGGHAIMARGVSVTKKLIRLRNSWGPDWGLNGECFVSYADMQKLLDDDGEASIPVGRRRP